MGERRANRTAEKKRLFLDAYRTHGTIYHAAQAAGVGRRTVYEWLDADPDFSRDVDDAADDATDVLEESGYRRAVGGDTTLTIFLLKGRRRAIYGDRLAAEHTGKDGGEISHSVSITELDRELSALLDAARAKAPALPPGSTPLSLGSPREAGTDTT